MFRIQDTVFYNIEKSLKGIVQRILSGVDTMLK
jgi:hypothetical protein